VTDAVVMLLDEPAEWACQPDHNPHPLATPPNPAYMIYTSGSTGRPKGVPNTHAAICNRLDWMQRTYPLGATDSVLHKTPTGFDVSVWEIFWPLLAGARLVLARPGGQKDPAYLRDLIVTEHVNIAHFVPSMLTAFLSEDGVEECRSLRRVICSGEELPLGTAAKFCARLSGCELHNLYGPTEAASTSARGTATPPRWHPHRPSLSGGPFRTSGSTFWTNGWRRYRPASPASCSSAVRASPGGTGGGPP
jgi:non-ribosomal peptide synthetase component F